MKFRIAIFFLLTAGIVTAQQRYDIIISELMADPSPSVGLPSSEWVEIRNVSASPLQLQGYRIGDATGLSGMFPSYLLQPDSFLIVCASSALAALSGFGNAIAVPGFPSLDNAGELIVIHAADGKVMHAIAYNLTWYGNSLKEAGGWTLEIKDPRSPCQGRKNWSASSDISGGTPGRENAVSMANTDSGPPRLLNSYTSDSSSVILVFDEPVDSASGATIGHYTLEGNTSILSAETISPLFDRVLLKTASPLLPGVTYTIAMSQVSDCSGNIAGLTKLRTALPSMATASDIVINEILFNPRSNGYDYVEIFNRSSKVVDAGALHIANRNNAAVISSIRPCSDHPHYIFPGDYAVMTERPELLPLQYLVSSPGNVLEVSSFPSLPDDDGTVVLVNAQGEVVDEVQYSKDWHFKLITDPEGVSLERIDPEHTSQDPSNWHSAASTAGYGTPGYKNSQIKNNAASQASFEIVPKVFSPDNDGRDDITTFRYQLPAPGYMISISIFDIGGRTVRYLVRNALLGRSGHWNWDGLGEQGTKLRTGTYIVLSELFNLEGKKERFKQTVVLNSD